MAALLATFFLLATMLLLGCLIAAAHDAVNRLPSQPVLVPFSNKWTGYGVAGILILLALYFCAWCVYFFGGCTGGLKTSATCSLIADWLGNYAYFLMFFGPIYFVTILLPAFILLVAAEFIYRRRMASAGAG
jgi:uncharacterized protein YqgC (DUF456 family)